MTRAALVEAAHLSPNEEEGVLRAIFVGLFAFALATQAAAAAMEGPSTRAPRELTRGQPAQTLEQRLDQKRAAARKCRDTIRFFESRRWLLSSEEHGAEARTSLRRARHRLVELKRTIAAFRRKLHVREARRQAELSPKAAICGVFGHVCKEAVSVAWCESRLTTTARNGQYLGLFQMGSYARALYGHGPTAQEQAVAAHEYFVDSGRDWSPWSCKPWYAE